MNMNRIMPKALVAGVLASTVACGADEGRQEFPSFEETILEIARNDPQLTTFASLVEQSGITGLDEGISVTVFAPTNAAFSAVSSTISGLTNAELSSALRYHIVGGTQLAILVSNTTALETVTGTVVNVRVDNSGAVMVGNRLGFGTLTETDIRALNGVIHKIDTVLFQPPPVVPPPLGNLVQVAEGAGLTTLTTVAASVGLAGTLSSTSAAPLTVFAPTNAAFAALGPLTGVSSDVLANILLTHVVPGTVPSSSVLLSSTLANVAKTALDVDTSTTPIQVGGARVSATLDVPASNGLAHVIDDVIIPPTTLEVANSSSELSTLTLAVSLADAGAALDPSTLGGQGPITVFAPVNSGFAAAGINPITTATTTLASVLQNHVVVGQVLSSTITPGATLTTLGGGTLTASVAEDGSLTLVDGQGNVSPVIETDIRTLSGVIHLIDGVLLP